MNKKIKDMSGLQFSRLHVLKKSFRTERKGRAFWVCRCDCGRLLRVRGDNLRTGGSTQCSECSRDQFKRSGRKSDFIEVGLDDIDSV